MFETRTNRLLDKVVDVLTSLERKVDQLMSTTNTMAAQLQAAADQIQAMETSIETTLTKLAADQSRAIADLENWIHANGATQINPATITQLQGTLAKLKAVGDTLNTLDTAAQSADLGTTTGTVTGTVTDAATQAPIAGAQVSIGSLSASTDANGDYTLPGVPVGTASLVATAPNYVSHSVTLPIAAEVTITNNFSLASISATTTPNSTGSPSGSTPVATT